MCLHFLWISLCFPHCSQAAHKLGLEIHKLLDEAASLKKYRFEMCTWNKAHDSSDACDFTYEGKHALGKKSNMSIL